jgi:type VI protein secretion system component Hcp
MRRSRRLTTAAIAGLALLAPPGAVEASKKGKRSLASLSDIQVRKQVDKSSPSLARKKSGKKGTQQQQEYFKVEMKDALITGRQAPAGGKKGAAGANTIGSGARKAR